MSIAPNASTEERGSPFYQKNQVLCEEWERYVRAHNGQIRGLCNAWSLSLHAKLTTKKTWVIYVKKGTYSSGLLLFSPQYQNLQQTLTLKTRIPETDCKHFRITRSLFRRRQRNHPLYKAVKVFIKDEYETKRLTRATLKNNELTFVFNDCNDKFPLVDKVLSFTYP